MSSGSALEAEELENVPLVRMEDVQPDRSMDYVLKCDEVYETCIVDDDFECIVDDEDSNIGSMVSIKSEDVICEEGELIVPEVLDEEVSVEHEEQIETEPETITLPVSQVTVVQLKKKPSAVPLKPPVLVRRSQVLKPTPLVHRPESWPTLEILPGGVINLADKTDCPSSLTDTELTDGGNEMMYACAKCSQSFKYLFCLVKHVRWHEEEARKVKMADLEKMSPIEKKLAELEKRSHEIDKTFKKHKGMPDKPDETKKSNAKGKYICLHSLKKKIVSKAKVKKLPKKS